MHSFICASGIFSKHSSKMLMCRLLHVLSSSAKFKYSKQKLLYISSSVSKPVVQHRLVPFRLLYYLEHEDIKEYKRFPSVLDRANENIKNIFFDKNPVTPEEWDDIKMEIMNSCLTMTDENFDSILMQVLLSEDRLQRAQSFMDYLRVRGLKPNFVTLCKYMVLCSKNVNLVGQDMILETYNKILALVNTRMLDRKMIEFLVQGLCATDQWRKSVDHMNLIHKSQLTTDTLDAFTCAALKNGDYTLAWDVMNHWYKSGFPPGVLVFEEYMKFVTNLHQKHPVLADRYFADLADYVRNNGITLKQSVVVLIEDYFKRLHNCATFYTSVGRNGVCAACKNKLEPCTLTKEEFLYLRDSFLKYSVKKSDIFINTTKAEFEKYYRFVEKHKPFDIVLDGLNIAHGISSPRGKHNLAVQLFEVVNYLSRSLNRILVLGRYHMKSWPHPIMQSIQKQSYVHYVSNISQDDPFLIYAALASGPNTLLVSLDMMRDHISRLPDPKLVHLFKKWQQSHQVYLADGKGKNEIILMGPLRHNIAIQGSMKTSWHVPYDNNMKREPYEELNNWLCIQKRI